MKTILRTLACFVIFAVSQAQLGEPSGYRLYPEMHYSRQLNPQHQGHGLNQTQYTKLSTTARERLNHMAGGAHGMNNQRQMGAVVTCPKAVSEKVFLSTHADDDCVEFVESYGNWNDYCKEVRALDLNGCCELWAAWGCSLVG